MKKMLLIILSTLILPVIGITIFVNVAPQFGATPEGKDRDRISRSGHYDGKQFKNLVKTDMNMNFTTLISTAYEWFSGGNSKVPENPLPTAFERNEKMMVTEVTYATWFGHSAILLETAGKRILIDPMFGPASSPVSFLSKRFPYEEEIPSEVFKNIDVVLISHDHYDHLDYSSIRKLIPHTKHFYVPLGVGSHLVKWGVDRDKITELDWWQAAGQDGLNFVSTPARHFSGRGLTDRNKTLWTSWVIQTENHNLFFSGDSGYFKGFKEIGEKYGPFDFTMIECGQYNENWAAIHMMPEESLQAHLDLKGKVMMPIHWGAFNLALHSWNDPVKRLMKKAEEENVNVYYPIVGQRFDITQTIDQSGIWWQSHQ